jgi:hypothetical protein
MSARALEELAREAGVSIELAIYEHRERFRDLIRNEVLEEAAQQCEDLGKKYWGSLNLMDPDCEFMECAGGIRALKKAQQERKRQAQENSASARSDEQK